MMNRHRLLTLSVLTAALLAGNVCGDSSRTPTPTAPTPSVQSPSVTGLAISGKTSYTIIGQSGQLTAVAALSDGTMRNVTSEGNWTSSDQSVVTVSPSGGLTIVRFGTSYIQAVYQSRNAGVNVVATPAGTFVISGWVREPGQGGIANVRVETTLANQSTVTNQDGVYSVASLAVPAAHLRFEKDQYEPVELDATPSSATVAMQRTIRLAAGETVTPLQLAPHDLSYNVWSDQCYPCRLVRVVASTAGTLHVHVIWSETRATLNLWAGDRRFLGGVGELTADIPVKVGEAVIYIGLLPASLTYYVPLTIETALFSSVQS